MHNNMKTQIKFNLNIKTIHKMKKENKFKQKRYKN